MYNPQVEELVDPSQYAADEHLEIKGLVVNPIFNNLVPDLILQAQRLTGPPPPHDPRSTLNTKLSTLHPTSRPQTL